MVRYFGPRRRTLGLSRELTADFFKVNISTVRKWECGLTGRCNERHAMRLLHFVKGYYDNTLGTINIQVRGKDKGAIVVSGELKNILLRSINIYHDLGPRPERQQGFLKSLQRLNARTLKSINRAAKQEAKQK
ncbi:MAG: hypothetical protein J6S21_05305 [Victivallales bacterium]|nr:hypothetical protein [Victivallales bacterium]